MKWRRKERPTPPLNARLLHADGSVTPLELFYVGQERGCAMFEATGRAISGDELLVDAMPAYTGIRLRGPAPDLP